VVLIGAGIIDIFVTAPQLHWAVVGQYLFDDRIMHAALVTVYLTAIAMVVGVGLGVLMAVMRLSTNRVMSSVSWLYIWFFRGTPVLAQLLAAILGLGLNEAAYMAEIVRAGIISVDQGQTEAAHALGKKRSLAMRRIVLPQAMRVIIPPT